MDSTRVENHQDNRSSEGPINRQTDIGRPSSVTSAVELSSPTTSRSPHQLPGSLVTVSPIHKGGFLGNYLSNGSGIKTNQLEVVVNTADPSAQQYAAAAANLRPIARLKEPRELFALPKNGGGVGGGAAAGAGGGAKDGGNECAQQTARWPIECQVLDERIQHIPYVPSKPEPYYQPTGRELRPRPVGDENGVVVYTYNPICAVNYTPSSTGGPTSSSIPAAPPKSRRTKTAPDDEDNDDPDSEDSDYEDDEDDDDLDDDDDDDEDDDGEDEAPTSSSPSAVGRDKLALRPATVNLPRIRSAGGGDGNGDGGHGDDVRRQRRSPSENEASVADEGGAPDTPFTGGAGSASSAVKRRKNRRKRRRGRHRRGSAGNSSSTGTNEACVQFSRSSVGGSKYLLAVHPCTGSNESLADLVFESRFESANLAKAVKITPIYYELYLRTDLYTNRSSQWFYFRVRNTRKGVTYRLSIVNLVKAGSLYNEGMRPLMYSTIEATKNKIGWHRCGQNIAYFRNEDATPVGEDEEESDYYTLTFNIEFPHDDDTIFFAHSYPYTYSDLQDYLMDIQKHPIKSKFCKLRLLCRSLAGNNVYYLTVTAATADEELARKKRAIVVSARVHPGETPASWMMKGMLDFITGDSYVAKKLRHKFIFKIVPMLNPDGVIVGNSRNSLAGKDLNRQYRTVIRETYPSIWYTKTMVKRLTDEVGVLMYCDMHAHSRKHNVFVYGCENKKGDKKLSEQVFPLMLHKNVADKFSFESCNFKVQRNKEGTGRIVIWMLGITNSYTMEASFGGSTLGGRTMTHFNTADYEHMGRAFCETLMDYTDDNPTKEALRLKIMARLNLEGSNADEPLNVPLSDYSSDEGVSNSDDSDSENEGGGGGGGANKRKGTNGRRKATEGCCCSNLPVPNTSPVLGKTLKRVIKIPKASRLEQPPVGRSRSHTSHSLQPQRRCPLDLPTTEPTFDSDPEYPVMSALTFPQCTGGAAGALVAVQQLGGGEAAQKPQRPPYSANPPELIVTAVADDGNAAVVSEPSQRGSVAFRDCEFPPLVAPQSAVAVPRALSASTASLMQPQRLGKPWHSLQKCIPVQRISNLNAESNWDQPNNSPNATVSFNKRIWTGVPSNHPTDRLRPISLGGVGRRVLVNRHPRPIGVAQNVDENENLLLECSEKLIAWQSNNTAQRQRTCLKTKKLSRSRQRTAPDDESGGDGAAAAAGCSSPEEHYPDLPSTFPPLDHQQQQQLLTPTTTTATAHKTATTNATKSAGHMGAICPSSTCRLQARPKAARAKSKPPPNQTPNECSTSSLQPPPNGRHAKSSSQSTSKSTGNLPAPGKTRRPLGFRATGIVAKAVQTASRTRLAAESKGGKGAATSTSTAAKAKSQADAVAPASELGLGKVKRSVSKLVRQARSQLRLLRAGQPAKQTTTAAKSSTLVAGKAGEWENKAPAISMATAAASAVTIRRTVAKTVLK